MSDCYFILDVSKWSLHLSGLLCFGHMETRFQVVPFSSGYLETRPEFALVS